LVGEETKKTGQNRGANGEYERHRDEDQPHHRLCPFISELKVTEYKTRSKADANSTQRTKAQRREPALSIVFRVFSNQPPEPEAAEQRITKERGRHRERGRTRDRGRTSEQPRRTNQNSRTVVPLFLLKETEEREKTREDNKTEDQLQHSEPSETERTKPEERRGG